jgi:alkylated DNA repair dioxygenase AlkB
MLFPSHNLLPFDGEAYLISDFISSIESNLVFSKLKSEIIWKQESMKIYGKEVLFPRLTAWYAENGQTYSYSGLKNVPLPFTDSLLALKERCENQAQTPFNSVLLNYYRSGTDSMGWHSDFEPELGPNPIIASLTFGATRKFQFKHKTVPKSIISINLEHGSLLLMGNNTQRNWLHQIPKTNTVGERINLTFRQIL